MGKQALASAVKQEQREYMRAWRARNKEKTAEYNRKFWEKKALAKLNAQKEAATDGKDN